MFTDSDVIQSLAPELVGLNGICVAKAGGKLECDSRDAGPGLDRIFHGQKPSGCNRRSDTQTLPPPKPWRRCDPEYAKISGMA